ncbi:MAG: rod shape-determining protein MreC [Sulfuricurvum sp.]|nr:rod shape-determining protein MreC [Sulfuricurvum sp.]MDD5387407.1 rod shape-determining protein MreC [Sulfuricurvum sp.]
MNKQRLSLILLLLACVGGALYFSPFLQTPFIHLSQAIKIAYLDQIQGFQNSLTKHISQEKTITELQQRNHYYERELLTLHQVASEYQNLLKLQNSSIKTLPEVELVRTISYVRMGDPHKLWLEMSHFDPARVYGLIYRGYVAGIIVSKNHSPMALLNGDIKSSYAVSVGNSQAPGIVRGNNERHLIVEFIPTWIPIYVGDEIVTSGLDQIFFSGLKVGKVISISKASGYQSAVVEPYFYAKNPTYFHVITKVK